MELDELKRQIVASSELSDGEKLDAAVDIETIKHQLAKPSSGRQEPSAAHPARPRPPPPGARSRAGRPPLDSRAWRDYPLALCAFRDRPVGRVNEQLLGMLFDPKEAAGIECLAVGADAQRAARGLHLELPRLPPLEDRGAL
jgi:hypothetical protein